MQSLYPCQLCIPAQHERTSQKAGNLDVLSWSMLFYWENINFLWLPDKMKKFPNTSFYVYLWGVLLSTTLRLLRNKRLKQMGVKIHIYQREKPGCSFLLRTLGWNGLRTLKLWVRWVYPPGCCGCGPQRKQSWPPTPCGPGTANRKRAELDMADPVYSPKFTNLIHGSTFLGPRHREMPEVWGAHSSVLGRKLGVGKKYAPLIQRSAHKGPWAKSGPLLVLIKLY